MSSQLKFLLAWYVRLCARHNRVAVSFFRRCYEALSLISPRFEQGRSLYYLPLAQSILTSQGRRTKNIIESGWRISIWLHSCGL
ncbi:unnamed protein product [Citrullus colocynthis]|uniref:Uncharacterized protein n=1 Tax=Citrullus colocynthis TaxID=252529 RepID=A0ABP0XVN8_9ROSI